MPLTHQDLSAINQLLEPIRKDIKKIKKYSEITVAFLDEENVSLKK
jgi:hypothetical protein